MDCPSCQHQNPPEARYCNACGATLDPGCPNCAHANPAGARFCNACGGALELDPEAAASNRQLSATTDPRSYTPKHLADRILTQKAALEGERKHVTVLFADLADSTALAEQVGDPEEMHTLMDRAFGLILGCVHDVEGTVNQFTGDGVMALFGAPIALEDAPRRAIMAGLAIQEALGALDQQVQERHGRGFRMRIGIHSGPVVVGRIGDDLRMDYTAVGDTTNLAARLEAIATPGAIVVSDATRRLVEGFFEFSALPPAELKGKREAVSCFEVVGEHSAAGRIDILSETTGLTPHVGRDREIAALVAAYDEAASGQGQVAFVVGEAGLGKSRLVHEFRSRLGDRKHLWIEGRCASFAQSTPFHAVADSMRRVHGIDDRDDELRALEKIVAREDGLGGDLAWTLPYVRSLLSLPTGAPAVDALDAMSRRAEMCRALHAQLVRMSERTPVVVVMEDMHWSDAATEEFLAFVADTLPAFPILLVVTHRPGYPHAFGDRSYHNRIPLRTLSEDDTSVMVGAILDEAALPAGVRTLISAKAEGNPLFVEEVTRSLLEEGILELEDGRAVLTRALDEISIPDRIQDVLMARLDRLREEPKRAIQIASIIGREFAMRLLSRIHEAHEALDAIVGELRALELIYEKSAQPELAYIFKHALTHEVAYESVLVSRRKALHHIVGSAIEELYPDRMPEHYEALAYHFGLSDDLERALLYHELASEKSAAAYANHTAIVHCQKALQLADELGDLVADRLTALQTRLGDCCWMVSDFGGSGEALSAASRHSGDPSQAAILLARAGWSFLWNHDYDRCRETLEQAAALASRADSDAARSLVAVCQDELDLIHGRTLEDDTIVVNALRFAEQSSDASSLVMALGQATQRAEWQGDYPRALTFGQRAIDLAEKIGRPGDAIFAGWFMAIAAICVGDYRRGLGVLGDGLTLCERIGDRAIRARLLNTVGWAYAEFGCHERAAEHNVFATEMAREAVELGLIAGAPELYANGAINLAGNWIALGHLDEAEAQLAPIQQQFETDPDPWMRWRWSTHLLHHQARLALARGDAERALDFAEREASAAIATTASKLICRAHEMLGRVRLVLEAPEEAELELRTALTMAEAIGHPPVVWRARSLMAEIARREGNGAEADRIHQQLTTAVESLAPGIAEKNLRSQFFQLGEDLLRDPLGAYR
jgi:class 3 adenylate cyclase/tetratricopeptide (TPR) repeat protein